jgi:hypothetical protein
MKISKVFEVSADTTNFSHDQVKTTQVCGCLWYLAWYFYYKLLIYIIKLQTPSPPILEPLKFG